MPQVRKTLKHIFNCWWFQWVLSTYVNAVLYRNAFQNQGYNQCSCPLLLSEVSKKGMRLFSDSHCISIISRYLAAAHLNTGNKASHQASLFITVFTGALVYIKIEKKNPNTLCGWFCLKAIQGRTSIAWLYKIKMLLSFTNFTIIL